MARKEDAMRQARQLIRLSRKVAGEVGDFDQLLRPDRRDQLLRHGMQHLRSFRGSSSLTTEEAEDRIEDGLREVTLEDGTMIVTSKATPAVALLLPHTASVTHVRNMREAKEGTKLFIVGTTAKLEANDDNSYAYIPTEGYKKGNQVVKPFVERDPSSYVQHGGFLFHNNSGVVDLLNYEQLKQAEVQELDEDDVVLETNWYMDSENQDVVTARDNLQFFDAYNTFGVLDTPDGPRYYTLNTYNESTKHLYALADFPDSPPEVLSTIQQLAAMSNVLARRVGATAWALGGLEYTWGGTYTTPLNPNRDHIAISYPQAA